jgi:hypothetical protein
LSSAARAITYLPIDGLIASLEDALAEIREIETRPLALNLMKDLGDETRLSQYERLRACKCAVLLALREASRYAKGPTA